MSQPKSELTQKPKRHGSFGVVNTETGGTVCAKSYSEATYGHEYFGDDYYV